MKRAVRALLEEALLALLEAAGVVKILCDNCARLMLFDAGVRSASERWVEGRNL